MMEIRFFAEFTSKEGNTWRINILDSDFTGTAVESNVGPPGFELEYFGGRDVYSPLMPSTCRVPWMVQSAAEETWIQELSDFQEGRYLLEIVLDPDGAGTRHWVGVMSPDSIEIPDAARPFVIGLNAVCGLALLNRVQYDTSTQLAGALNNTALDHVLNAVRNIPGSTTDIFPILSPMVVAVMDVRPATGTASNNFMQHVYLQAVTNDIYQGRNTVGTFEDMLVQLLTMMNCRIYQRDGVWMLQSITRSMGAVNLMTDVKAFDRLGTTVSTSNISNFRKTINQTTRHRTNGAFSYMPAVRKVSRKIDFFGNLPFAGDSQISLSQFANDGNTASPYAIGKTITGSSDVTLPTTQTVRVTGFMRITVPWFNGLVSNIYQPLERVQRFKVKVRVRVGTKYLRRTAPYDFTYSTVDEDQLYNPPTTSNNDVEIFNPGPLGAFQWTTDSGATVDLWSEFLITGGIDNQGIPRRTAVNWDFESPEIGTAESADVEVRVTFAGYHGEADSQNPDAYVSQSVKVAGAFAKGDFNLYLGDGSASADAITYAAELDNNATEEITITEGIYGEVTSSDIYVYNPAALLASNFVTIPGFYSTVTASTTPLAELLCIDRLKHFGKVQRCWQGTIYSPDVLDPFNTLVFDSAVWMPVQMGYSAEQDDYEIECIAVEALTVLDPDGVDPVRDVGTTQPPTAANGDAVQEQINRGARDRSDISETVADIETDVANINRTTTGSGGDSSVLLQYLGDVKISGPVDGQVLEYNNLAQRWANVTPSGGGGTSYHNRYNTEAEAQRIAANANVELYYTARPDGDGIAESATSDTGVTDTINRTLSYSEKYEANPNAVADWTEYTAQPADNATFATAKAALLQGLGYTNATANTRGTLPLSLKMVRTTTPAVANRFLNDFPNSAAAYSTRLLDKDYAGSCMLVRRSNDNATAAIGFDSSGNLSATAMAAHCGTAGGYCVTLYDQSGNGKHLTQSIASAQPYIYNGTAIVQDNNRAALQFSGSQGLNCSTNTRTAQGACTVIMVRNVPKQSGFQQCLGFYRVQRQVIERTGQSTYDDIAISTAWANGEYLRFPSADVTTQLLHISTWDGTTQASGRDRVRLFENGGSSEPFIVGTGGFGVPVSGDNSIGWRHDTSSQGCTGYIQEVIIYHTDESSEATSMAADINSHFDIF